MKILQPFYKMPHLCLEFEALILSIYKEIFHPINKPFKTKKQ